MSIERSKRTTVHRSRSERQVWIGLVHVKPTSKDNKFFGEDEGAYATALAWALNSKDFRARVAREATRYSMRGIGAKEIEPFLQRRTKFTVERSIVRLAVDAKKMRCVRFGTFFAYPKKRV